MKKKYIAVFICMIMLVSIPITIGQANQEVKIQKLDTEPQSVIGLTFIAGLILNPQQNGKYIRAKAVLLAYYDRGLIIQNSGIGTLFKDVRFKDGDLLYMSEPGQFGLVQVAGICTGFSIQQ